MNISNNPTVPGADSVKTDKPAASKNSVLKDSEKSQKVRKVIEEFEGVFMSMMIKQLRETDSGEGFFPGDHSDTYGGMFDMFMGQHLARGAQTGLETLFESATARSQLENYLEKRQTVHQRSKGIEEYKNEQFRSNAAVLPSAT
jgi:Rod binding domain-containing protein